MIAEWLRVTPVRSVSNSKRRGRTRRTGGGALRMERLEHRLAMAIDIELFSVPIVEGRFQWSGSSDRSQMEDVQRMAGWVGSQLGINIVALDEASLSGQTRIEPWNDTVFTFAWEGMEWDFRDSDRGMEFVDLDHGHFHNSSNPMDTNQDGMLAPLDVLLVIDFLNSVETQLLPNRAPLEMTQVMVDVTGDRWVTALDALTIINGLNSGYRGGDSDRTLASDDYFSRTIPSDTKEFPASEIDVLRNDSGIDLRIVDVSVAGQGLVEILEGAGDEGQSLLRYTPGSNFRDFDFFTYTVEDAAGNQSVANVWVEYVIEPGEYGPFNVVVADSVRGTAPGAPIAFRDASGKGLISVEYGGAMPATVGVYLRFAANEPPFGIAVAGTLNSDIIALDAAFYPDPYGGAWITGSINQVNAILAGMWYEPAPGFSAPEGFSLTVSAFLYGELGGSVGYASDDISIIVPADPLAPVTIDDFFTFPSFKNGTRLRVLANDSSPSGTPLRVVGIATFPGELATSVTTHFGQSLEVDTTTNEVVFRPGYFGDYLSFVYVVSDSEGRLTQGSVALATT